jgi:hypothetical protein
LFLRFLKISLTCCFRAKGSLKKYWFARLFDISRRWKLRRSLQIWETSLRRWLRVFEVGVCAASDLHEWGSKAMGRLSQRRGVKSPGSRCEWVADL